MRVAEDLLGAYQHRIDSLTLTPGPRGIFDVVVNGEPVFSKHQAGRHAQPDEVLATFTGIIGPDVR
ncbi:MAG: Rdx family protein, partial [Acidimicrobiales bacterium]